MVRRRPTRRSIRPGPLSVTAYRLLMPQDDPAAWLRFLATRERTAPATRARVPDLGCGSGRLLAELACTTRRADRRRRPCRGHARGRHRQRARGLDAVRGAHG